MKKYNWFSRVFHSLTPSDFYIHALKENILRAIGYMALLILTLSLTVGIYQGLQIRQGFLDTVDDLKSGVIPAVSYENGQLVVEGNDPVVINHFNPQVVLDDDLNYDINDVMANDDFILFQQSGFSFMTRGLGPFIFQYENVMPTNFFSSIPEEDMIPFLQMLAASVVPASVAAQFTVSMTNFFANSIFVLLFANIMRLTMGLKLRLGQIYHMTIYAMTFSVFWTHFTTLLPRLLPIYLDNFVFYGIPGLILLNVFIHMRRKALEQMDS